MERVVAVSLDNEDKAYPYSVLLDHPVIHDQIAGENVVIFFKKGTASALDSKVIADGKDVGASGVFYPTVDGETVAYLAYRVVSQIQMVSSFFAPRIYFSSLYFSSLIY